MKTIIAIAAMLFGSLCSAAPQKEIAEILVDKSSTSSMIQEHGTFKNCRMAFEMDGKDVMLRSNQIVLIVPWSKEQSLGLPTTYMDQLKILFALDTNEVGTVVIQYSSDEEAFQEMQAMMKFMKNCTR